MKRHSFVYCSLWLNTHELVHYTVCKNKDRRRLLAHFCMNYMDSRRRWTNPFIAMMGLEPGVSASCLLCAQLGEHHIDQRKTPSPCWIRHEITSCQRALETQPSHSLMFVILLNNKIQSDLLGKAGEGRIRAWPAHELAGQAWRSTS